MTFSALDSEITGPLFATAAMRAAFSDRARLTAMIEAEAALARVQARLGLVPEGLAPAIAAIDPYTLDLDRLGAGTALAGVPTIPFVQAVQARLPRALEPFFHKGATTQDILDTALALQMRTGLDLLAADLALALAALAKLAQKHRRTPCVARSYGQQAQPISFGFKAAVWAAGLLEVASDLPDVRQSALRASLGGPAGTLAGLGDQGPDVADGFAGELGLGASAIAWHTRRTALVRTGTWLATLIGALAKMATDVVSLASTEIGEVGEPHVAGRGGSSAMPHKRNPVSSTVILAAHGAAPHLAGSLLGAMAAQHERPAGAWHAEWHALPTLFGLASGALAEARRLAEGLEINADRMRLNLEATRGLLFADAVAGRLAATIGRARAHRVLEAAADRVRDTDATLREVLEDSAEVTRALTTADLDAAFDVWPYVEAAEGWIDRVLTEIALAGRRSKTQMGV